MTFEEFLTHKYTHAFKHVAGCHWCDLPAPEVQFAQPARSVDDPFRVIEKIKLYGYLRA